MTKAEFLYYLSAGVLLLAGLFIIITIILWFVYSIPEIYRDLSDGRLRKSIRALAGEQNRENIGGKEKKQEKKEQKEEKKKQEIKIIKEIILVNEDVKGGKKRDEW